MDIKRLSGPIVEEICGGHVVLDADVVGIRNLKKAPEQTDAHTIVAEYALPTRIDFLSPTPPVVGNIEKDSISLCEIHVPAGALQAFLTHRQWGMAAYFVDADGNAVDRNAARHATRLKRASAPVAPKKADKSLDRAKEYKIKQIGAIFQKAQVALRLAQWSPRDISESFYEVTACVTIGHFVLRVSIPKDANMAWWDATVARLEKMERSIL